MFFHLFDQTAWPLLKGSALKIYTKFSRGIFILVYIALRTTLLKGVSKILREFFF
jgi:hypothetical protein